MKINIWMIVGAIVSIGAGAYLQHLAMVKNNQVLLAQIDAQIQALNQTKTNQKLTPSQQTTIDQQITILQAQENLLKQL